MAGRVVSRMVSGPSKLISSSPPVYVASRFKTSSSGILQVTQQGGVRRVLLNNEPKRNALSYAMLENLATAFMPSEDARLDDDLSCVVISAHGRVFSAGHDLKELREPTTSPTPLELFDLCSFVMSAVHNFPVPVIAEVSGLATAAGCQLVASCDIVMAGESAKFATPGVNIGLFCTTPSVPLLRCVPDKIGMHMLFTGEPITAQEAQVHGLVSKVVPDEDLRSETDRLTDHLCSLSKEVLSYGKVAVREIATQGTLDSAYSKASRLMAKNAKMEDCQEGISAFFEKRHPEWNKK